MYNKEKARQERRRKMVSAVQEEAEELGLEKHYTIVVKSMASMQEAHRKGLLDGRRTRELAQVILYLNAKNQGVPIRHSDLNVKSSTARCYEKILKKEMGLEDCILKTSKILDYYITEGNLQGSLSFAQYIDREVDDGSFTPLVKAAGILYYISDYTQKGIGEITNISTVSIRRVREHIKGELMEETDRTTNMDKEERRHRRAQLS